MAYSWDYNVGPLTTTATFLDSCYVGYQPAGNDLYRAQHCAGSGGINGDPNPYASQDDIECWPELANNDILLHLTLPLNGLGYYSPGIICPSGYATVCHHGGGSDATEPTFSFQFPVASTETAYGCCPVGFKCVNQDGYQTCTSVPTSTALSRHVCTSGKEGISDTLTIPYATGITYASSTGLTTYNSITIYAPMIQIVRQASDDSLLEPSASASISSVLSSPTSQASAAASSASSATVTPVVSAKHTLSTGAVVGISVGVSVLVLSLLAGAAYCFLVATRKKAEKRREQQRLAQAGPHSGGHGIPEMPSTEVVEIMIHQSHSKPGYVAAKEGMTQSPYTYTHELDSHNRHYVQQYAGYQPVELQ